MQVLTLSAVQHNTAQLLGSKPHRERRGKYRWIHANDDTYRSILIYGVLAVKAFEIQYSPNQLPVLMKGKSCMHNGKTENPSCM
jgi:hypothetical protein